MTAMTSSTAAPSSSSPRKPGGLRGPRPQPLKVSSPSKPAASKKSAAPVIVYEHTPKVVHARPQEFMTVVQRLTGKQPTAAAPELGGGAAGGAGVDPLLLTLGQRRHDQAAPAAMAAGLLMSPGFVFSPNTMQYIQELSPLL